MKKILILLALSMFILTGCFDKKTRTGSGNDSDYLGITNLTDGTQVGSGGSVTIIGDSSTGTPIILESSTIVPIDKVVTISFTEDINAQTVNESTIFIADSAGNPIAATLNVIGNQINIIPIDFFLPDSRYTIVVTTEVKDIRGRGLEGLLNYSFISGPDILTPPNLISVSPANGTLAPSTTDITMVFSEEITGNVQIILQETNTNDIVAGSTTVAGDTIRFNPSNALTYSASYTVTLQGSVEDLDGNIYTGAPIWSFTVLPESDTNAPLLEALTPSDGTEADISTLVSMNFNEVITGSGTLTVRQSSTNAIISGTNTIINNTLRFISQNNYASGENYVVTLVGNIEDLSGNIYNGLKTWSFFTVPLPIPPPVDITPPTLLSLTPLDGAIDVNKTTDVVITLSENINNNGVILEVRDTLTSTLVTGTNTISGNSLTFTPDSDLADGEAYTVNIVGTIEDLNGNVYVGQNGWSFTVADTIAPTLVSLTPLDGAIDVNKTTDVVITLSENINNNGVILEVRDTLTSTLVTGTNTISGNSLTFTPDSDLADGEAYTVNIVGTIEDLNGNVYVGQNGWSFTVADTIAPTLVSLTPLDGAINVDPLTDINVTFNENVTNEGNVLSVFDNTTGLYLLGATEGVTENTLWFIPASPLIDGHNYTVTIIGVTEDLSGNDYVGQTSWNFIVQDLTPPTVTAFTPADGAVNVDPLTDINVTFSEFIDNGGNILDVEDLTLGSNVSGTEGLTGNTLWFIPDSPLIADHNYSVLIHGRTDDLAGNEYIGQTIWYFTVAPPPDTTAPALVSLTPFDGQTDANKSWNMTMTFDENIVDNGVVLEVRDSNNTLINGSTNVSANTINFNPSTDLEESMTYTVTVQGSIEDNASNVFILSSWSFTVADTTAPSLVRLVPSDGSQNVDKNKNIRIVFDETIVDNGVILEVRDSNNTLVSGTNSIVNGVKLRFVPDVPLSDNTDYNVTIVGTVVDGSGNEYLGQSSWSFKVLPAVDDVPPGLVEFVPADSATDVDKNIAEIYVRFDENVTNDGQKLTLYNDTLGVTVSGTAGETGDTLWFTPDSNLIPDHNYTVTIDGITSDLEGNPYAGQTVWSFHVKIFGLTNISIIDNFVYFAFSYKLNELTVSPSDFEINSGSIYFNSFFYSNLFNSVTFIAEQNLGVGDVITIRGTIEDEDGNLLYGGNDIDITIVE